MAQEEEILSGGNMNAPLLKGDKIYKESHIASKNIDALLKYAKEEGVDWIPESYGFTQDGKHILSYIEGEVPEDTPTWLWDESILIDVAKKMRQWHDITANFEYYDNNWLLENNEPNEVICHSDFAPYNCVFENRQFKALIDFDVCSPGSRLWDISYAVYRFVPLFPVEGVFKSGDYSPFTAEQMLNRLEMFLISYSLGKSKYKYSKAETLIKVVKRVNALAEWSYDFGTENKKPELLKHAEMYKKHGEWILDLLTKRL